MTTRRSVILRPHEARRLAEHDDVLIVWVVKPQPHPSCSEDGCGWHWHHKGRDDHYMFGTDETHLADCMLDHCPFGSVGDELWGREAWSPDHRDFYPHFAAVYKADNTICDYDIKGGKVFSPETNTHHRFRWYSAATMPRWASRFPRLIVDKIECRRIRSVTEDEAVRTGLLSEWDRLDGRAYDNAEKAACRLTRTIDPSSGVVVPLAKFAVMFGRHGNPTAWNGDTWCWFATLRRSDAC